jgi:hypothetical protein
MFCGIDFLPYLCIAKPDKGGLRDNETINNGPFVYRLGREIFIL